MGNGKSISIRNDAWIPGVPGFKSMLCTMSSDSPKVDSLISRAGEWDVPAVRNAFPSIVAEAILDIHLSSIGCDDSSFLA